MSKSKNYKRDKDLKQHDFYDDEFQATENLKKNPRKNKSTERRFERAMKTKDVDKLIEIANQESTSYGDEDYYSDDGFWDEDR